MDNWPTSVVEALAGGIGGIRRCPRNAPSSHWHLLDGDGRCLGGRLYNRARPVGRILAGALGFRRIAVDLVRCLARPQLFDGWLRFGRSKSLDKALAGNVGKRCRPPPNWAARATRHLLSRTIRKNSWNLACVVHRLSSNNGHAF